jgi:hypothetical protein
MGDAARAAQEEGNEHDAAHEVAAALGGAPASGDDAKKAEEAAAKGAEGTSKSNKNTLPIRAYLDQNVVPILLQALSQLVKERPDGDPVEWLAHYLLRNNKKAP